MLSLEADARSECARQGRRRRRRGSRVMVGLTIMLASVLVNGNVASAHQWGSWHWHRGGSAVYIYVWNGCGAQAAWCEAARKDIHYRPHPVYLIPVDYHTDISMLSYDAGNTGWGGLAQMINYSYPHVTHAHATLNMYYGYNAITGQGIQCQEVAHTLGLDHAATGDCMGMGYYSAWSYYFGANPYTTGGTSHPSDDLRTMYSTLR